MSAHYSRGQRHASRCRSLEEKTRRFEIQAQLAFRKIFQASRRVSSRTRNQKDRRRNRRMHRARGTRTPLRALRLFCQETPHHFEVRDGDTPPYVLRRRRKVKGRRIAASTALVKAINLQLTKQVSEFILTPHAALLAGGKLGVIQKRDQIPSHLCRRRVRGRGFLCSHLPVRRSAQNCRHARHSHARRNQCRRERADRRHPPVDR